ncbi:MAG: M48 family metallopeptidase [Lachnospiraceae bacterium]|nr:M48 family metallopeptidase [Lachnospiraceae bacterium]MDE7030642.1 M48 family metallopeptidase [Lachnospiraceae bacterium]
MAATVYSTESRTIVLEGKTISYELARKAVRNVNLRIDAAGTVKVSASRRVPLEFIEGFLRQKQALILTAVERAEHNSQQHPPRIARQYVDGEQLTLLGDKLVIRVLQSGRERVERGSGSLYFFVRDPADTRHKELMYEKWLKAYRCDVYEEVCRQVHARFCQYKIAYPAIRIRRMTSRWGSCQPYRNIVTLNSRLIETPPACIEYVAMHEFCHFIHPDHSKAFHALMTVMMPDWKQRRQALNAITEWNE